MSEGIDVWRAEPGVAIFGLAGEHDDYSAPKLARELATALEEGLHLVVDLRQATFLGSTFVSQVNCLSVAVAGTNGKSTTAELIERLLSHNHRKTLLSGHRARPLCSVVEQTKELDFLVLQVNAFQLEVTQFFRPAVAVLMNLAPDHLDRYASGSEYVRANARLFRNQQAFDWAIVQSEALARLRELELPVPAKTVTFSATNPNADIYLDRGLLLSRLSLENRSVARG